MEDLGVQLEWYAALSWELLCILLLIELYGNTTKDGFYVYVTRGHALIKNIYFFLNVKFGPIQILLLLFYF